MLVVLVAVNGQLWDQFHDCIAVLLHLGPVMFDEVLDDDGSWYEVVAAGDGLGCGGVPRADEDRQVLGDVAVLVVAVVVVWDNNDTGITCRAALATQCAAEPSVVECVVVAVAACGVPAPMLCNKLPICEFLLAVGALDTKASALSVGDCACSPLVLPVRSLVGQDPKSSGTLGASGDCPGISSQISSYHSAAYE